MQTPIIENLVLFGGILFLIYGFMLWMRMVSNLKSLPLLAKLPHYKDDLAGPKLSIIITACNEEKSLERSIPLLLAQTYHTFELILINDRSTDNTGTTIESYVHKDSRIRSIHIDHLPDGWLGKVNALQKGVDAASGEYYLFTDADIEFSATAISSAMAHMEHESADHLTVFPFNRGRRSFFMGLMSSAYGILFFNKLKTQKVSDPKEDAYIGIGAFNLVKRTAFERTPGFPWLRMEVIDDLGLGLMLKKAGFRTLILNGLGAVELNWYPNLWAMITGLEKNLFSSLGRYSYQRALVSVLILLGTSVMPIAATIYTGSWILGIATLLLQILIPGLLGLKTRKLNNQNAYIGFLIPFGFFFIAYALARSTFFHYYRKGICWRGTYYSTLELKRGSRVCL